MSLVSDQICKSTELKVLPFFFWLSTLMCANDEGMSLQTRSEFEIACIGIAEHRNRRPPTASLHHHGWWAARRDHVGALYLELNVSHAVYSSKCTNGLHSCVGAAAALPSCTSSLPDEPLRWSDDDDDDERCRSSSPLVAATSSGVSDAERRPEVKLDMTYFVVWSEPYQCPIIYFHALATPKANSRTTLRPTVQQLMEWIMPDICDPLQTCSVESSNTTGRVGDGRGDDSAFGKPIVSEGFSEELQRAVFSVHPCDMSSMLRIAHDVLGEPQVEEQQEGVGNGQTHYEQKKKGCPHAGIVVRLLRMCGPSIGIPSDCLPL
jgi:hypothetical protein